MIFPDLCLKKIKKPPFGRRKIYRFSPCQKIVQQRLSASTSCLTPTNSRPSTPNNHFHSSSTGVPRFIPPVTASNGFSQPTQSSTHLSSPSHHHSLSHKESFTLGSRHVHALSASNQHLYRQSDKHDSILRHPDEKWNSSSTLGSHGSSQALVVQTENNNIAKFNVPHSIDNLQPPQTVPKDQKDLPTPTSTPTTSRKTRRRSNLFTPSKKGDDKLKNGGDIGSGRAIPIKQGYLYKRSNKPLNKEWKKKYVTLCDDGRLTYHPSLHDYMDDVHGKEISLQYVTVKVPGQKPRGSKSIITVAGTNGSSTINEGIGGLSLSGAKDKRLTEKVLLTAFEAVKDPGRYTQVGGDEGMVLPNSNSFVNGDNLKMETPNVKKRHRRMKSSSVKNSEYDDSDVYEFYIVSLDNKQWHFEAVNSDERDEWVSAIEQQILSSLQLNESSKGKKTNNPMEAATIQTIRNHVPGNEICVDCDCPNPSWASLNLGVLMCIECSGIHRNLGSHISKVRSLDLDEWPAGHLSVMLAIGNALANSVWENRTQGRVKPSSNSPHEEKEQWIRAKYETKEFLPPPNNTMPLGQQLVDAVCSTNMKGIVFVLAQANVDEVNSTVAPRDLRTPLHLACAMGNLAVAQLLIWHNANVSAIDHDGRTCLAYARAAASIAAAKSHTGSAAVTAEISAATSRALVELLLSNGCPEVSSVPGSGTLPRRRGNQQIQQFEKLPSSVI